MVAALAIDAAGDSSLHRKPVGGAATSVYAGRIEDDDENPKTRGEKWRGTPASIGEAQKMLTDPHVRASRDVVVDPVINGFWDFEPGGSRPIDIEAAEFARWVFFGRIPWKRHVGEIMRAYMADGFAVVEKTDDVAAIPKERFPLHPLNGLGYVVTGLYVRPGWSIVGWKQNRKNTTQVYAVEQYLAGGDQEDAGVVEIPRDRFIRFTWEQSGANYEGSAPQRCQWGPWFVKRLLTRIETMGHERNHVGSPIGKREAGSGSEDGDKKLQKVLENFRAHEKGAIVLEPGYSVEWSQHGQQTNIGATIVRCNFDMAHAYQAGFMMLGQNGSGSYALAGTQQGQFEQSLIKHADFICDVMNFGLDGWSLVEHIIRKNYGADVAIPMMCVRFLPTVDFMKSLPIAVQCVAAGLMTRDPRVDAWVRYGLKAPAADPSTPPTTADEERIAGFQSDTMKALAGGLKEAA